MHVELWTYTRGQPRVLATIRVTEAGLHVVEHESVPAPIKKDIETAYAWKKDEGELGVYHGLVREFSGSYYRARLIR